MIRLAIPVALVPLLATPLAAQSPRIDSVLVRREAIFDTAQGKLGRIGNAMHVRTRPGVVRRELLQGVGEPYDSLRAAETARNLRALGVFRRVLVDTVRSADGVTLRVITRDGWSIRPQGSLSTAAGQTSWSVGVREDNFAGLAATLGVLYRSTPDRSSVTLSYRQPRAIADRIFLSALADLRSDGRSLGATVALPFLSFSGRRAWEVGALDFDGDVLRFRDGNPTPSRILRRRYALLRATGTTALVAGPSGYVRLGVMGQVRRDDTLSVASSAFFPHTTTAAAGVFLAAERADFLVVRNVSSFLREEDVAIGPAMKLGVYAAPSAFGYADDGVGLEGRVRLGVRVPRGYLIANAAANGRFASGLDSGTVRLSATGVLRPSERHALVLYGQTGWQRNPVPGEEFDLGLGVGLRAYPLHAYTGDRMVLLAAEYRWTALEDCLGLVGLGVAAFGEWGGAWFNGSPARRGGEAGVGLRWGFNRGTDGTMRRIDLVRRFQTDRLAAGWSIVVGDGFVF